MELLLALAVSLSLSSIALPAQAELWKVKGQ